MIAGATLTWWAGFHAAVLLLLAADGFFVARAGKRSLWLFPALMLLCAAAFAGWVALDQGARPAMEFAAGYTIEVSLSIDNLFVFLVLFQGFHLGPERQHKALLWGVTGAVIMRALFIAAGIGLMQRFHWITWVFGAFLLYGAFRLARGRSAGEAVPGWIRNLHSTRGSLLPIILAVELTDLLFATDSIPAVLAVTRNPFIAYTSNIAAILGLRSLYFALADMLNRFRYLHYGLSAILAFVGLKMIAAQWFEIPITLSLGLIGAILGVTAWTSAAFGRTTKPE
ncbi:MAG: TerC family protein [Acidobacteriota bacterium]